MLNIDQTAWEGLVTQWRGSQPQPPALGNHSLWLQPFSVLAPTVSMGPAQSPRPNVPPFQSHVKEERDVEGGSELAMTMGSSVLQQLSFPILAKHQHTLWVEWPFILSGHFILFI